MQVTGLISGLIALTDCSACIMLKNKPNQRLLSGKCRRKEEVPIDCKLPIG
ncbi:hypothetical protein DK880_00256 [Candidatus Cardinium hertigii]|uniref:Uncharacterized protein n=1 Tax=Candidatus Cardinium hertigii TaxID=247481 RepID=A0A2Z3L7A9_9BACT|nr:hypothetical protein DK880_00256 [Candidatus Cardinium hertigii]